MGTGAAIMLFVIIAPLMAVLAIAVGSANRSRIDAREAARDRDLRSRGWAPLPSPIRIPPALFRQAAHMMVNGYEMVDTAYGRDGWATFTYAVVDNQISGADFKDPSDAYGIVFLVAPWPVNPARCAEPAWCTINNQTWFRPGPHIHGCDPAIAGLLGTSPFRPNALIVNGRLHLWVPRRKMPDSTWHLDAGLERDLIPLATELQRRYLA